MINTQPIEKQSLGDGSSLSVHSIFHTIQGEGPFSGQSAVFIRLAGCNLQCPGCDTDYTSDRKILPVDHIVEQVRGSFVLFRPLVVITGGEPFRQNLGPLFAALISSGFKVQVETNGTLPPSKDTPRAVTIVCSPKTPKLNHELSWRADYFKYVLSHDSVCLYDGLPIRVLGQKHTAEVARPPEGHENRVFIQPMDTKDRTCELNLKAAINSCKNHGHTLQIQLHKLIGVE